MRKTFLILLLLLVPQVSYADTFSAEFRYWLQHPTPDLQANTKEFDSYKANEPLELSEAPEAELKFRLNKRHSLKANFAWLTYKYSKAESQQVGLFLIGSTIEADLTLSRFSLGWEFDILDSKYVRFGTILDMKFAWLKYNLSAGNFTVYGIPAGKLIPTVEEKDEVVIFLPSAGTYISLKFGDRTRLNLEFSGSYVGSYSGLDFNSILSVSLFDHLALTGGYKVMYITMDHEKIEGSLLAHGPVLGLRTMF
jgi:hypothetical protein